MVCTTTARQRSGYNLLFSVSFETIAVVSGFSKVKVAVRLVSTLTLIWLLDGCSPSEPKPKSQ